MVDMKQTRRRMIEEEEEDRLSALPDDVILKILSLVGIKDAIGTSVLSPGWRNLWRSVPHLSFSSEDDLCTRDKLPDFVTRVLMSRCSNHHLSSFKLYIRGNDGHDVAHRIMNHAFFSLTNVQQLSITFVFTRYTWLPGKPPGFPLSLSGSQTLKQLTLSWSTWLGHIILASTRELSSLTTLHLSYITLSHSFLSMCPVLENLALHSCKMTGSQDDRVLSICHPRLSNLTLENGSNCGAFTVNVFTPQLKNLTISRYPATFRVSAPELASLLIRGDRPYMFSTDGFPILEQAQLSLHSLRSLYTSDGSTVISLLQELHNVKFLSLSADVVQLLNKSLELISHRPSPFAKLKSLKILPKILCMVWHKRRKLVVSAEVENYLLNGSSPKATLTKVLREHCCDVGAGAKETSL